MLKKYRFYIGLAVLAAALAGCGGTGAGKNSEWSGPSGNGQDENVEESQAEESRTAVSMMYMYNLPHLEALVEETYPDIDLQIESNAEATLDGESERRLNNGHGTDLVTTTMPTGGVREFVTDLSAEPYVDRYQTAIFQNVSDKGRTMFIPLPGQYYGYIYNKTLLEQGGIPVPDTQMGTLDMLDAAAEQGLGVGQDGTLFAADASLTNVSTWLLATQVPDFLGQSEGIIWNEKVLKGEASFADGMSQCLNLPTRLAERGYLNTGALNLNSQAMASKQSGTYDGNSVPIEKRMLSGELMMVYGSTRLFAQLNENSDKYEFAILPFMGNEGNKPWTIIIPDGYLSINAALTTPGNEAKLDACSRVLDLLSTPEGQQAYIADCGTAHSYLSAYDLDHGDVPEGLAACVEEGYVYNVQFPARLLNYFGRQMLYALNGEKTLEEALADVDHYNQYGDEEADYDETLIGLVAEDLIYEDYNVRQEETALGNLIADAVREMTGSQMAFVNGGSIRGSFYAGNVFGRDLDAVCPYDNTLVVLEVDGATIHEMLANGISTLIQSSDIPGGRFLNVSGLGYCFEPPAGDKPAELVKGTLPDGSPLDESARYTITVTNYMAGSKGYLDNNGDGYVMLNVYSDDVPRAENVTLLEETDYTFSDALKQYFANHSGEAITSRREGRIKVVTAND